MGGPKKRTFKIEALKHRVVVDPKYAGKTWRMLEDKASGLSFEELYRSCNSVYGRSKSRSNHHVSTVGMEGVGKLFMSLGGCWIKVQNVVGELRKKS